MAIVLDAMGSDDCPQPEIEAAIYAAKNLNENIILVGHKDIILKHVSESDFAGLPIEIVHAEDILEMGEKAVKSAQLKPNNSMAVGLRLVKEGKAEAFLTAGNTGAAMFNSLRELGRIRNVARPALTALFPTAKGFSVVIDIGANSDCRPEYLLQFAVMGSIYAEAMQKISKPKVGLLNNGEEPGKGNELMRTTYPLLESSKKINFIGNVEAKEVFAGKADVVVTDGFTGNIFLKTSEATAKMLTDILKEQLMPSIASGGDNSLAKNILSAVKSKMDPNAVGAAPLLGIDGLVFVGHGRSNSTALISAIKVVREALNVDLVGTVRQSIQEELA